MVGILERVRTKYRQEGLTALIKDSLPFIQTTIRSKFVNWYNNGVRTWLPRTNTYPTATGDVKMGSQYEKRMLDELVPWRTPYDNPRWGSWNNYEPELVQALQSSVHTGDTVVIVGAGRGVTSVVAGKQTGTSGSVISFEANLQRVNNARQTIQVNDLSDTVDIRHGTIGEAVHVPDIDQLDRLTTMPVDSLPDCDVLELDCEGAELEILRKLQIRPREIIVETHGCYGAPESDVRSLLSSMGYTILSREPQHEERDIIILTATADQGAPK